MRIKGFRRATTISVGTSPVEVPVSGKGVLLYNDGAGKVFLGPPEVSPLSGLPVDPSSGIVIELEEGARIYAVSDSSATLRVLEVL